MPGGWVIVAVRMNAPKVVSKHDQTSNSETVCLNLRQQVLDVHLSMAMKTVGTAFTLGSLIVIIASVT